MISLQGKRIFIVEDNTENRIVYQMIFIRYQTIIEFERWGPMAIHRLQEFGPVDLIILDLMLRHGLSGYTIFDEIRKLPAYNHVPIIAVSSSDASEAIPKTKQHGFSGYIAKPIDQARFPELISQIIAGESIWDEGE